MKLHNHKNCGLLGNFDVAMDKKVLYLPISKKWFDMILCGIKKEEYREVKEHWMRRIAHVKGCGTNYNFTILRDRGFNNLINMFDYIVFKNGYRSYSPIMMVECKGVIVDQGKKCWGAPNYRTFVIKLGNVVAICNIPDFAELSNINNLTDIHKGKGECNSNI